MAYQVLGFSQIKIHVFEDHIFEADLHWKTFALYHFGTVASLFGSLVRSLSLPSSFELPAIECVVAELWISCQYVLKRFLVTGTDHDQCPMSVMQPRLRF